MTELECLAIYYACTHASFYLTGAANCCVLTDHRALVGLFNKALPDVSNVRVARFREKLQQYNLQVDWVPGKGHLMADALSRAPAFQPDPEESCDHASVLAAVAAVHEIDPRLDELAEAAAEDDEYQELLRLARAGGTLPKKLDAYKGAFDSASIVGTGKKSLLFFESTRVFVPQAHRKRILKLLHSGHCGYSKTLKLAHSLYYWPGLNNAVKQLTESCGPCRERLPSQQRDAPVEQVDILTLYPMSDVGVDLFSLRGKDYVVLVDRYSGYPVVQRLTKTTTQAVTGVLSRWFGLFGIPTRLRSDGGPQFRGPFDAYCEDMGIKHELSSAYNPESNGLAESAVKAVKNLLDKCMDEKEDQDLALLAFRNTPREDGATPACLFYHRQQRTLLPASQGHYAYLTTAGQMEKAPSAQRMCASKRAWVFLSTSSLRR